MSDDYLADEKNVARGRETLKSLGVSRNDLPIFVYGGVGHAGIWFLYCERLRLLPDGITEIVRPRRTIEQVVMDLNSENSVALE